MTQATRTGGEPGKGARLAALAGHEPAARQRSLWGDALRRLSRNRLAMVGLGIILLLAIGALAAPALAPYNPTNQALSKILSDPGNEHLLGTDQLGRDTLSRLLYGARISLAVGIFTQAIVLLIGATIGGLAALGGPVLDNLLMRFTDIVYAFPDLLLVILFSQVFRNAPLARVAGGIFVIFLAIAIAAWVGLARLIRGQMLSLKQQEYVIAARALGASQWRIFLRHLLPNTLSPVIVTLTFGIPGAIFAEAALSYIGIGVRPPTPTWGGMINEGYASLLATPWPVLFPGLAIAMTMLSFTFLGDGLRDALDPTTRAAG